MVIPIGPDGGSQELYHVTRLSEGNDVDKNFVIKPLMGVRYVPLVKGKG